MWRNVVSRRNWFSIDQTAQCLKRSSVLSLSFSSVPLKETVPDVAAKRVDFEQTDVSLSFAKHLLLKELNRNVVVSPLSIQVLLSLAAAGSKGSTQRQLLSFLKADYIDDLNLSAAQLSDVVFSDDEPCLGFNNALWFDQSLILKPSFKQIADSHYKSALTQGDFQNKHEAGCSVLKEASSKGITFLVTSDGYGDEHDKDTMVAAQVREQINSWINFHTNGAITDVIQEGSPGRFDRLAFTDALYFNGEWLHRLLPSKTKHFEFLSHKSDGKSVIAPAMATSRSRKKHFFRICDGFSVIGHPYNVENRKLTMYIFYPSSKDGLPSLIERFGSESGFLDRHLPGKKPVGVYDVRIPKFKFSYEFKASDFVKELGLTLPFLEGGLTEMADSVGGETLSVSNIYHKAFIVVDEDGTRVVAANFMTTLEANEEGTKPEVDVVVDHPFLFIIREDMSGAVLFVGQMVNPLYH